MPRGATAPLPLAQRVSQRWTMDFIEDRLVTGQKFRTFNVVDAFSRKGLASEVDTSLPGVRVRRPDGLSRDPPRERDPLSVHARRRVLIG